MSGKMEIIDVKTWDRQTQYENFINYSFPIFSITSRIDVTELVNFCKREEKKFFSVFLYIVAKSINKIKEFKTRIVDGKIVVYDVITPSFIVLNKQDNILTCRTPFVDNFSEFYSKTRIGIEEKKNCEKEENFNSSNSVDCFFVSCLPWIDMHAVINPYNFNDKAQTSIPRITWGKYVQNANGRFDLGFDVSAHHAFLDGYHVAKLIKEIENEVKIINEVLTNER